MNLFNFSGDTYGSSSAYSPSIKNHLRPFDYDIGSDCYQRDVRLDNVEPNVGKSGNTSHICSILLPYSQCQRKDKE